MCEQEGPRHSGGVRAPYHPLALFWSMGVESPTPERAGAPAARRGHLPYTRITPSNEQHPTRSAEAPREPSDPAASSGQASRCLPVVQAADPLGENPDQVGRAMGGSQPRPPPEGRLRLHRRRQVPAPRRPRDHRRAPVPAHLAQHDLRNDEGPGQVTGTFALGVRL